jgi:D-alanyl-D-alanine carboxypeptidase
MSKLILSIAIICSFLNGYSQNNNYKSGIDSLLNYLESENYFLGMVTIQKYDKVIYTGNFNLKSNGSNRYKIGSVTKVFTAIITHQLIDEGKLNLSTTLDKYFPTIKYAELITISNLLSHTSGIFNVTDWDDYYSKRTQYFSRQDIVNLVSEHKCEFKPNTDCSYSNTNYILLGYIIEDITGKSYSDNVKERISDKIGLSNTYCETSGSKFPLREQSYKYNGETWIQDTDSDPSLPFAAGSIVSTTEDLCKMMYYLAYKNVLSDSSLAVMKKIRGKNIGHGLFKVPFYEKEGWGHTGRIDEFRSLVLHIPKDSLFLSITSNGLNLKLNEVIIGILSTYYGRKYSYPTFTNSKVEIPSTNIFIGTYKAKLAGLITVARFQITQAGRNYLFLSEANNNKEVEKGLLVRQGELVFYSPDSGGLLTFKMNKKGKITGIKMKQGKFTISCKKIN